MITIKYRFARKTVSFTPKSQAEADFFLKILREFGIEIVSVQRTLVLE